MQKIAPLFNKTKNSFPSYLFILYGFSNYVNLIIVSYQSKLDASMLNKLLIPEKSILPCEDKEVSTFIKSLKDW